mgnify:CR=1 FL=1
MQFDRGYLSPYFINDQSTMSVDLESPYILLHDKKISNVRDLLPVLEGVAKSGKPLLIVAEDVEGEALATLVVNSIRGIVKVCAVKAPGFGDRRKAMLEDIAVLTNGTVISEEKGYKLESASVNYLGTAKRVEIDKDNTTIVEGAGEALLEQLVDLAGVELGAIGGDGHHQVVGPEVPVLGDLDRRQHVADRREAEAVETRHQPLVDAVTLEHALEQAEFGTEVLAVRILVDDGDSIEAPVGLHSPQLLAEHVDEHGLEVPDIDAARHEDRSAVLAVCPVAAGQEDLQTADGAPLTPRALPYPLPSS